MLPTRLQLSAPKDYSELENKFERLISNKFTLETESLEDDSEEFEKNE